MRLSLVARVPGPAYEHLKSQVITGPSGVGKSTLIKKLMAEFPGQFGFSVSHTTREPRAGEEAGIDYHFVARDQMQRDIEAGLFVEHAEVHGNLYGTSIEAVQAVTRQGKVCLLDIDVQGAESVRQSALAGTCSFVFFAPPTAAVLEQRLRGRGTETEEKIQKRLSNSLKELAIYEANPGAWDLTLQWYNEQVEDAYQEFRSFLAGQLPKVASPEQIATVRNSPAFQGGACAIP
ncbi:GK-1 [Symbiodinium natans]|uniref:guanylate kinase n=1 Tax=Symbiodinium natans TaxID=878477 RepID=A0A812HGQ1_9DINO|nr:GK-1 [Symbiodinium natans]